MATVLMRSSRSPIFDEIGDLVTVVFDRQARTLAQTEFASIIAFGAGPSLAAVIEAFGDDVHDGDVFIHNDVYSGGNQFADVGVYMPVFHDGELVAWTASKGHIVDIGGMTLGGYDPAFREVWQEAFRIPPLRLHDRGVPRQDVERLVRANVRLDLDVGGHPVDDRRLHDRRAGGCSRCSSATAPRRFDRHMDVVIEASERQVRARDRALARRRLPRRELHAVRRHRPVAATADRGRGDDRGLEITFDFSGSDDQAPGFTNMPPPRRWARSRSRSSCCWTRAARRPDERRPLRARCTTVFREGLADQPALPGRDRLRQPDVRRGASSRS